MVTGTVSAQTWNGSVSSDWNNASNWNGGIPGTNSTATIPGNTSFSPVISSTVSIKHLVIGDWNNATSLTVDGGSLTVAENVSLYNYGQLILNSGSILFDKSKNNASFSFAYQGAALTLNGGTFTSDLDISVNGALNGGSTDVTMNGKLTIANGKTATISGGNWTFNDDLIVNGTVDLGNVNFDLYGKLTINSGGIFYAGSGQLDVRGVLDVGDNGTYNGEDAYTIVYNAITAKNSAFIRVNNGTIEFRDNVDLFQTATLEVVGTGTVSITGSGDFKQNGNLLIGDGNLIIGGNVSFQQGGTLDVESGSVSISGDATFAQAGTMNIATGTITIDGDANFNQTGTVNAEDATITISGNLTLGSNGSTFNAGGSTINLEGGTLTNNGTFNPDSSTVNFSGSADQNIVGDISFYNLNVDTDGELNSTGNVIVLNTADIDSSSTVTIDNGNTLEVQGELIDPNGAISAVAPYVRNIQSNSINSVRIEFSSNITSASANTVSNYAVNKGITVASATLQTDAKYVDLVLNQNLIDGVEYTFTFNNIVDAGNGASISSNHTKRYIYKTAVVTPGNGVSNLRTTLISETTTTLNWNNNSSAGAIVIVRMGAPATATPTNNIVYTSNAAFGSGSNISGQQYVVFSGTDSVISISGLTPNREYHATVYTYNGEGSSRIYNAIDAKTVTFVTPFKVEANLLLSGAMNDADSEMNTDLIQNGTLPLSQPFSTEFGYNGTESVTSFPSTDIVDWVLVEIRHANSSLAAYDSTVVAQRAAFILKDGRIVDLDGISSPQFSPSHAGNFVVILYHRNHIPAMSADTLTLDESNVYTINFSQDANAWFDTQSALELSTGEFAAAAGGVEENGTVEVTSTSYNSVWSAKNTTGYTKNDVNLDGEVNALDRAKIFNSRNANVHIPAGVPAAVLP